MPAPWTAAQAASDDVSKKMLAKWATPRTKYTVTSNTDVPDTPSSSQLLIHAKTLSPPLLQSLCDLVRPWTVHMLSSNLTVYSSS